MLPKNIRLDSKQIPRIAKTGKKIYGDLIFISFIEKSDLNSSKFAISISKKVDKKAVVRNKIKRKLREAIRFLEKEKFFKKGEFLVIPRTNLLATMKTQEIAEIIKKQIV